MNVVVSACIMVIYVCASLSNHGTGRAQAGAGRRSSASLPPTAGTTRDQFRRVYLPQIGGQPNGINNRHSVNKRENYFRTSIVQLIPFGIVLNSVHKVTKVLVSG
ncbi:hypothetical protein BRADI_2g12914v3 [Brachypodium distachyon]|uniref:Secreted protein n=1 Tax=Brachypodium distachyon TaxID=15368 RepID=A0A0Q3IEE1_BRADI|nr:hypothetical protein BRADI_2g12914v3 [Brachypodium distachyon]